MVRPAHAELVEARATARACLDKLGMSGMVYVSERKEVNRKAMTTASPLPASGAIEGGIHRLAQRVYFEDTDTAGIMYHAKYLHFMERGRTEFLRVAGIDHGAAVKGGEGAYAVTEMQIKWLRPAKLDDVLTIETRLLAARAASCSIAQRITRAGQPLLDATLIAAFLDPAGRPRRQPRDWMARFHELLAQEP